MLKRIKTYINDYLSERIKKELNSFLDKNKDSVDLAEKYIEYMNYELVEVFLDIDYTGTRMVGYYKYRMDDGNFSSNEIYTLANEYEYLLIKDGFVKLGYKVIGVQKYYEFTVINPNGNKETFTFDQAKKLLDIVL